MGAGECMMKDTDSEAGFAIPALMDATMFAADKHRDQKRKDARGTPYINHPIMVANLMASVGGITDIEALQAALLHDTVEDTDTTPGEIEELFGYAVRGLVMEVTDEKSLHKDTRKRLQIEHAPHLSPRAKVIKVADKIANVVDMIQSPPAGWPPERRIAYLHWARTVVKGCLGANHRLECLFKTTIVKGLDKEAYTPGHQYRAPIGPSRLNPLPVSHA
jgi:guanosine-3',5'-bis(diphosphate) 3'-pyrophosphohydrolase